MKPSVSVGIPFYGNVANEWWAHMFGFMANLSKEVDYHSLLTSGNMTADNNRNQIVKLFLEKSKADYLFWVDSDTCPPYGAVTRLAAVGKTLISGLYYGKNPPHPPIAYHMYAGAYAPIDKTAGRWEKGDIIPVAATGLGCMLMHRSVFEDILKQFDVYQGTPNGGLYVVYKNSVIGPVEPDRKHVHDGKVYRGQLRQRLIPSNIPSAPFPFFQIANNKTEDIHFFELARKAGHVPYLDTSVECGHLREVPFGGKDYRDLHGR